MKERTLRRRLAVAHRGPPAGRDRAARLRGDRAAARRRARSPINPFFFLIGLTYAVSLGVHRLAAVRRAVAVADRRALRHRRGARLGRGVPHRRRREPVHHPLHAADRRREHGAVPPRRPAGGRPQHDPVLRRRAGAVPRRQRLPRPAVRRSASTPTCRRSTSRSTPWRSTRSGSSRWRC